MYHYEESLTVLASPKDVFSFVDDHANFSSHMSKSSWMMGGGKMGVSIDAGQGQQVGSHIRLNGKAFGISIYLDEIVTQHQPPHLKVWETVGMPKLLIIGRYQMKIAINPKDTGSLLLVSIDYDLPPAYPWLGKLFGGVYAKWCVRQMTRGVRDHFQAILL